MNFSIQKEITDLPLIITIAFFAILFLIEGAWYLAGITAKERELARFHAVEHPRRMTSDLYLDMLG